ncbi:glycoside hydrolase [Bombardia bombarda]|uniref:lytic cellulose monooxygenase (C4-dehydrogenating) n=1 Tax=Bombardia bombarda TaxID=252184 RepID=A0AA39U1R1_9PEZI|nr:glycoside hydrolase [Bombardia bombarda]
MLFSSTLSTVGLFAAGAAAHGAVTSYVIGGKTYPGYQGFSPGNSKNVIQRQWPDYNPITSCTAAKLRCNGGTSATESATVAPGDSVSAVWSQWTHSQGPVIVWMYKCSGAFSSCDGSGSGWFKIDEGGFHGDGVKVFLDSEVSAGWDIAKLVGGNKQWTSKIPAGLAPGNYLIRHELIALHQANAPQFYPECAQVQVTGSGTAQPDASYKAAIPGYCKDTDSNIKFNINNHALPQTYVVPGPPVYKGGAKKVRDFSA